MSSIGRAKVQQGEIIGFGPMWEGLPIRYPVRARTMGRMIAWAKQLCLGLQVAIPDLQAFALGDCLLSFVVLLPPLKGSPGEPQHGDIQR